MMGYKNWTKLHYQWQNKFVLVNLKNSIKNKLLLQKLQIVHIILQ